MTRVSAAAPLGIEEWVRLARLPFHSVGILPFLAGSFLALHKSGSLDRVVMLWGLAAIVLIMFSTYLNGEIHDRREDALSATRGRTPFSGGSLVLLRHPHQAPLVVFVSAASIVAAMLIGVMLQWFYRSGPLTIPLGVTGIVAGYFYSKPPLRWVTRGFGEILIAYAYGWLPVAVGYYLQTQRFDPLASVISLPIACSIFNVILMNEYPDHPADVEAGKRNLLARLGERGGAYIYAAAVFAQNIFCILSVRCGVPLGAWRLLVPCAALSAALALVMLAGGYRRRGVLIALCGLTITVNIGISCAYILSLR